MKNKLVKGFLLAAILVGALVLVLLSWFRPSEDVAAELLSAKFGCLGSLGIWVLIPSATRRSTAARES